MEGYDGLNIKKRWIFIRNLHTLLRTHTKMVKLPLKMERLRTLGSFLLNLRFHPDLTRMTAR